MAGILRGDIVWADLNSQNSDETGSGDPAAYNKPRRRPVLILSHTVFNENSGTVIALAISGKEQTAGFPLTFELNSKNLPKRSWVMISQTRTLLVERLGEKIAHLNEDELNIIIEGLNEIIGG